MKEMTCKMKKTYITPTMEVTVISMTAQLLAGSLGSNSIPYVDMNDVPTDVNGFYAD